MLDTTHPEHNGYSESLKMYRFLKYQIQFTSGVHIYTKIQILEQWRMSRAIGKGHPCRNIVNNILHTTKLLFHKNYASKI